MLFMSGADFPHSHLFLEFIQTVSLYTQLIDLKKKYACTKDECLNTKTLIKIIGNDGFLFRTRCCIPIKETVSIPRNHFRMITKLKVNGKKYNLSVFDTWWLVILWMKLKLSQISNTPVWLFLPYLLPKITWINVCRFLIEMSVTHS